MAKVAGLVLPVLIISFVVLGTCSHFTLKAMASEDKDDSASFTVASLPAADEVADAGRRLLHNHPDPRCDCSCKNKPDCFADDPYCQEQCGGR